MSPEQINDLLRIRRRREERALERMEAARNARDGAAHAVEAARQALSDFDTSLERKLATFFDRARSGIDPGAVQGMRTFRADQLAQRPPFLEAIEQANVILGQAEELATRMSHEWQLAAQAAENLQTLARQEARKRVRERERRLEMEQDDLSSARLYRVAD